MVIIIFIIVVCVILLLTLGIIEKIRNEKNLKALSIRVNVNGIRGKSTVTRLITGIITEAGYKTVGKTTGTAARMIYWFQDEEKAIERKIQGANIGEQIKVIDEAASLGAEALVCECMAVRPEYQDVFQNKMFKANIAVIVNVLEDHMDVMGPTLDQVAQAFTNTIPYNGYLVTIEGPYTEYFEKIAKERNTELIVADNSKISQEFLNKFDYMVFPDNASLALGVAQALGIDEETAFRGMLNAHPDPGAMRVTELNFNKKRSMFVNGFAANDPSSTLAIWDKVCELYSDEISTKDPIVIMNCRPDRVDRTEQFVNDVIPHINGATVIAIGEGSEPMTEAFNSGKFPNVKDYYDWQNEETEQIMEKLTPMMNKRVVYGVGNIHGSGEPFIEALLELNHMDNNTIEAQKVG